jgi:RNA polymerase sigma factor (sigma-70 family)
MKGGQMASSLEQYVRKAKNGDRQSLETVVSLIQDKIYGLALRMLGNPNDAEDEAQEILIKIITHLSDFREESAFTSWVYRIACNHLLTALNRNRGLSRMTFEFLEEQISAEPENTHPLTVSGPERHLLEEEARLDCMQGVLACLETEMRIVFILGDLYGFTSKEGAFILDITPEAFRKRLSRGRKSMQQFMMQHCGLVNESNPCRCHKLAAKKLKSGGTSSSKPSFVKKDEAAKGRTEALAYLKELTEIDRTVSMFRRYPECRSPDSFTNIVKGLVDSGNYKIFMQ